MKNLLLTAAALFLSTNVFADSSDELYKAIVTGNTSVVVYDLQHGALPFSPQSVSKIQSFVFLRGRNAVSTIADYVASAGQNGVPETTIQANSAAMLGAIAPAFIKEIASLNNPAATLDIGIDISMASILSISARAGAVLAVQALIDAKADLNHRDENNTSPVLEAIANNYPITLQVLADAGAKLNCTGKNINECPIAMAAFQGNPVMIDILLAKKVDLIEAANQGFNVYCEALTSSSVTTTAEDKATSAKKLFAAGATNTNCK